MDRLPCELLHHILGYIDQSLDLFRMTCVCSRWRSFIMNDEYFLNQWFSRSLECSRKSSSICCASYVGDCKRQPILNIDRSLFSISLQSNIWDHFPSTLSGYLLGYKDLFARRYSLPLFDSSHSFSLWLFLPRQWELNIQIGSLNIKYLTFLIWNNKKYYHFNNWKFVSIADRWIHIVLNKIDRQSYYQIWLDGQYVSKASQYHLPFRAVDQSCYQIHIILVCKSGNNILEASSQVHLTDVNAFTQCLTPFEIRAIHQQQTSITQVKVGTYINSNKMHNMKIDCR
ncbi:unnamed protein product [Rotaria sordida]|uniref:F-box domain-containing protein n=1 Tax=Rotaria sordida TaxID=392033 RepID=A0A815I5K5_9BILA|nr:unnamed protein product [Rotaria sordida]